MNAYLTDRGWLARPANRRSAQTVSRHAWWIVLLVGAALYILVERTMIHTSNPNYVPSLLLLGACTVPVSFIVLIASRAGPWTAGLGPLAVTALFGGVIGTVVAGRWEFNTLIELGAVPTIAIGIAEEIAKLIVPVLVWLATPHRRPVDGLMLGVASGMGFAALETMGYGFVALLSTGGNLAAVDQLIFLRGI